MNAKAFTRVDLLVLLGVVGALGLVGVSLCADTRERSQSIVCMNNLRQIGRGFHAWAAEHGGQHAWWVFPSDGGSRPETGGASLLSVEGVGTFPGAIINNAFFHFLWVYEDLPSPDVLVCPADEDKRRASDFSTGPQGLAHPSMQNSACSYLIGVDTWQEYSWLLLSADRNVIMLPGATSCSTRIGTVRNMGDLSFAPPAGWTSGPHQIYGHALANDGSVDRLTSREFSTRFRSRLDGGLYHVLPP